MAKLTEKFPRNITEELHTAWLGQRRKHDTTNIAKELVVSKVTIEKAIIAGHVTMAGLSDKITQFFEDRIAEERKKAATLNKSK